MYKEKVLFWNIFINVFQVILWVKSQMYLYFGECLNLCFKYYNKNIKIYLFFLKIPLKYLYFIKIKFRGKT